MITVVEVFMKNVAYSLDLHSTTWWFVQQALIKWRYFHCQLRGLSVRLFTDPCYDLVQ